MWMWIGFIAFAVAVVLAAKMLDRRGSRDRVERDDLPGVEYTLPQRFWRELDPPQVATAACDPRAAR